LGRGRRFLPCIVPCHRLGGGFGRRASSLPLLHRRANAAAHRLHGALLFALFPVHTDATTSVVGSAELLAAAFSLGALIFYYRHRPIPALMLFALAVFSKESAAAFAALPMAFPRKDWRSRDSSFTGAGAVVLIAAALWAHHILSRSSQIPAIDNPAALVDAGRRILSALWV
jgi:hypothetical protein